MPKKLELSQITPEDTQQTPETETILPEVGRIYQITRLIRLTRVIQGHWYGAKILKEGTLVKCMYENVTIWHMMIVDTKNPNFRKRFTISKNSANLGAFSEVKN